MTIKSKPAGALFAALTIAAPLALGATPASAAPRGVEMAAYHVDVMRDHGRRPPLRVEHRGPAPHGHFRWHAGAWSWRHDHWQWAPGVRLRF